MNEELTTNYIRAFTQLVDLVRDTDTAIQRAQQDHDQLGVRQYQHLKRDYVHQLAELISQAPQSIQVQAVPH